MQVSRNVCPSTTNRTVFASVKLRRCHDKFLRIISIHVCSLPYNDRKYKITCVLVDMCGGNAVEMI